MSASSRNLGNSKIWARLIVGLLPNRIAQWMERKAEVERMLSAAAAKKEFALSESELMAGEEKAMLMAEQQPARKSPQSKVGKMWESEVKFELESENALSPLSRNLSRRRGIPRRSRRLRPSRGSWRRGCHRGARERQSRMKVKRR